MQEILDLIVKYGLPMIISGLAIWGVVDFYVTLKKDWAPGFLKNFETIALNVKGLNENVGTLSETLSSQSPHIEEIHTKVNAIYKTLKIA